MSEDTACLGLYSFAGGGIFGVAGQNKMKSPDGYEVAALAVTLAPRTESVQFPVLPIIPHSPQKSRYSPENGSTKGKKHSPHSRKKHSTVSRVQNIAII